jgi:phage shock protein C
MLSATFLRRGASYAIDTANVSLLTNQKRQASPPGRRRYVIMETRRVIRSRNERIIGGVAGGLAAYLNIDPLVVRLIFAVLSLANGLGIVLYLIMWLLVPQEDTQAPDTRSQVQENVNDIQDTSMRFFNQVREMFRQ